MRNKYKEIFDEIKPDNEILEYAVISAEMQENYGKKSLSAALSVALILTVVGAGLYFYETDKNNESKEMINIPVAYETKEEICSERHITKQLKNAGKKVKIDADVIIEGRSNEMCIYKAEFIEQSVEKIENLLYSENGFFKAKDERKSAVMPILHPRGTGITFDASPKIIKPDEYSESKTEETLKDYKITNCKISYSEARKIADLFLAEGGFDDYFFVRGNITPASVKGGKSVAGYYDIQYYQYSDGFPLETVSPDVYNGVASDLNVKIDDDGISGLRICGLNLSVKEMLNGEIMDVEAAIKSVEENLPDLWLSEYAPVVEIRLEYLLDELDDGSMELVPCWHFCIDETELKHQSIEIQRKNDTNDLCINAVTGEMYRVGNRYPVYQYSDGSIVGTWSK